MAEPIQHSASGAVAETASSGLIRGTIGVAAGFALAVAASAAIGALALGGITSAVGLGAISSTASTIGMWAAGIASLFTVAPVAGAVIGGTAGAMSGVAKTSNKIQQENMAAKTVEHGHNVQVAQQLSEVRQQAAEEYTQTGYNQGMQDGQMALMQQLQQHAIEQQQAMANAPEQAEHSHAEKGHVAKELERRGANPEDLELAGDSHADKVKQSREHASADHAMAP